MARQYQDTQSQNFWKESINKEAQFRMTWHERWKSGEASKVKSRNYEVFRKKIEDNKPSDDLFNKLPKITKETHFKRKKADFNEPLGLERACTEPIDVSQSGMRPPTPKSKSTLYDGFTKEGKGRRQYLDLRNGLSPEKKFFFPFLSSWEYGWKQGEVVKKEEIKKPTYGRKRIVDDTFYTRNGIPTSV